MYSFMVNLNPIGEYYRAFEHSLSSFRAKDPEEMARMSGAVYKHDQNTFYITSLGQQIKISYPDGQVSFVEEDLPPLWEWQLIILNYLSRARGQEPTGKLISYRELEAGDVFYAAFKKNSIDRLATKLGAEAPEKIIAAINTLGGQVKLQGKITAIFNFLPKLPVTLHIWPADEEFSASVNILFDSTANGFLHTEDIAVVGSLLAGLIGKLLKYLE